jgi:hypothetical protein
MFAPVECPKPSQAYSRTVFPLHIDGVMKSLERIPDADKVIKNIRPVGLGSVQLILALFKLQLPKCEMRECAE